MQVVVLGMVCLALALASIGLTLWVTWQLEGGGAAVNEAGRMRMLSYRLALDVATGKRAAVPAQLRNLDETLDRLERGDPSRPLFVPWNDALRHEFRAVRTDWRRLRATWAIDGTPAPAGDVDAFVQRIDRLVFLIEQRLSYWTELLRACQLTMVVLAIAGALLLFHAMHRMVLEPLRRFGEALGAIRAGDFGARVRLAVSSEFGELAEGFNAMAARLQSLYGDLEAKVRDKTASLEVRRQRLATLYEVSAFVGKAENLDELAQGFSSRVRRVMQADAIALRWCEEGQTHSLLLASEGLPEPMAAHEHCLANEGCLCGRPAHLEAPIRAIPLHAGGPARSACAELGFRTLVTVPVSLHQRRLGEIDLLYRREHGLDDEDRSLLDTLAGHLAGGIESLRAAAADREAAVTNERTLLAQELHDSIAQSLAFLKIQVELMRAALKRADPQAAARTVDEIDAGVRESYADVRELLTHFRMRSDTRDIEAALRSTLQKFEQQSGLPTALEVEGQGVPLPVDVQIQVLHVIQEALSNVRKHARATRVRVRIEKAPAWRFEVADDGCGFDPRTPAGESHVGLKIMMERARRIGAEVRVRSEIHGGTRVGIAVPRTAARAEPVA
jgi:two-component system nitrate/nitrite sensor histidine kinase NarX